MSTVTAILFRAGGDDTDIEPLPVAVSSLEDLQGFVGGYIESVRETFNPSQLYDEDDIPSEAREFLGVAYVNEDGISLGLPVNRLASIVFGRQLLGDVVMVSGSNPSSNDDDDDCDGDDYDVPLWFANAVHNGSLLESAEMMELISAMTAGLKVAIIDGLVSVETLGKLLLDSAEGDEDSQRQVNILFRYGQIKIMFNDTDDEDGVDENIMFKLDDEEISKFWEEETK